MGSLHIASCPCTHTDIPIERLFQSAIRELRDSQFLCSLKSITALRARKKLILAALCSHYFGACALVSCVGKFLTTGAKLIDAGEILGRLFLARAKLLDEGKIVEVRRF